MGELLHIEEVIKKVFEFKIDIKTQLLYKELIYDFI